MQGSDIGPASYVINAADLTTVTAGNLVFKYADNTYIVIPAANVNYGYAEFDHTLGQYNNLIRLNRAKSVEIIFTDGMRKPPEHHRYLTFAASPLSRSSASPWSIICPPASTSAMSSTRQVRAVRPCHETAALPWHDDSLRHVYKAVVLSKLLYASPAWWGYTSAADKQCLQATIRRAIRLGLYTADDLTPSQIAADVDDNLFCEHTEQSLSCFVQTTSKQHWTTYNLRPRRHSLSLTVKTNCSNFINTLLKTLLVSLHFVHGCVLSSVSTVITSYRITDHARRYSLEVLLEHLGFICFFPCWSPFGVLSGSHCPKTTRFGPNFLFF